MLVVGLDLGTQSLKAVVCDANLVVRGAHQVAYGTRYPQPGWAEQDPAQWEAAIAPAIARALAAAGAQPSDVAALAIAGQLDGCIAVDANGEPLHAALIWQDKRAVAIGAADIASLSRGGVSAPAIDVAWRERVFAITGQVADPSHMAPKARWLRERGIAAACFHQPTSYLVERLTGERVLDHAHASTTMLYDLAARAWSTELLAAFALDARALPRIADAASIAGALTARGAALTGLPIGTRVAVGTGDDFATPLGAGVAGPGHAICAIGTAEVVGALSSTAIFDRAAIRDARSTGASSSTSSSHRSVSSRDATSTFGAGHDWPFDGTEPMLETHAYPTGAFFIENPGWLSGGAVRWTMQLLGLASDAELDALAASAPPGAGGVTFVPALAGAMTPVWRPDARGTLHGLSAAHDRSHVARAVLEGLAFAERDVIDRLAELGVPIEDVLVLGGGGNSAVWTQLRADALGRTHHVAARTDTSAIAAAMLAAVAAGMQVDLAAACATAPGPARSFAPQGSLDEAYARYRRVIAQLAPLW